MKKLIVPALLSALLVACGGKAGPQQAGVGVDDRSASVATVTAPGVSGAGIAALTDPSNILSRRSVYFDFDQFVIKQEFIPLVEAHAGFLSQNPGMRMMVQGNTDERGSREYNLALGQKRAEALKQALVRLGASANQIEAVSLGEEKPRCTERSEACFAENRRSDMLYAGEF